MGRHLAPENTQIRARQPTLKPSTWRKLWGVCTSDLTMAETELHLGRGSSRTRPGLEQEGLDINQEQGWRSWPNEPRSRLAVAEPARAAPQRSHASACLWESPPPRPLT